MSYKKQNIEISVPELIIPCKTNCVGVTKRELFTSNGHTCSYCHGNGWFWNENEAGESIKKDCPVCHGSGMLDAVVTVEWRAHPKDIETV